MQNPLTPGEEVALVVGGVAVVGVLAYALWPKAAAASSGPTGAAVVTTPAYVQTAQSLVATMITNAKTQSATNAASATPTTDPATMAFYTLAVLTAPTANGSSTDPTFVTDLAAVQTFLNTVLALPASSGQTYAQRYQALTGQPWQTLRTDGVLDGFTYQALAFAAQTF
jgi:hypothetical protein